MTLHEIPSFSGKQCTSVQGSPFCSTNRRYFLCICWTRKIGRQKSGRITGRTRCKSSAYRSAKNLSVTTLKLPAQVYRTDRLAVHHPVHEEPVHELHELLPWELEFAAHGPQESSSSYSGSRKTDLRCPGWFQGFGALPCPFAGD